MFDGAKHLATTSHQGEIRRSTGVRSYAELEALADAAQQAADATGKGSRNVLRDLVDSAAPQGVSTSLAAKRPKPALENNCNWGKYSFGDPGCGE